MCRLGDAPTPSVTDAPGGTPVTSAQRELSEVSKPTPGGLAIERRTGLNAGRGRPLAAVRSGGPQSYRSHGQRAVVDPDRLEPGHEEDGEGQSGGEAGEAPGDEGHGQ